MNGPLGFASSPCSSCCRPPWTRSWNRDERLTHFEYFCLAMLSEAPQRTLRMTELATRTNATLPRLSRVISGLESNGLVRRVPCPTDRRATNAVLTEAGWDKIEQAAPGHVASVREFVIDALTRPSWLSWAGCRNACWPASIPTARWSVASARTESRLPHQVGRELGHRDLRWRR